MRTCSLRRTQIDAGSTKRATPPMRRAAPTPRNSRSCAERLLRVAITLSSLIGWRSLANLLAAIPDSSDDFGML